MILRFDPPFEKQKQFLRAKEPFVAYGGSRGGGKSYAVRIKASLLALRHGGIRILILRRTLPELYENHIKIMRRELAAVATYRDGDKSLEFRNRSLVKFGYLDSDGDLLRYQGQEFDVIFIDEATHFSEYQFRTLCASLRGPNDYPKRVYLTCNPGGVGHGWVKRLFIDRDFREGERAEDYVFIRSSVYDNKPLLERDPAYPTRLSTLPDDVKRAWLDGDWNICAGQYFPEFRRHIHTVEPHEIPSWWLRFRAIDYGLDMLACVWAASDGEGRLVVYRELCAQDLIVSEAAEKIRALSEGEDIRATYAPPDIWNRQKDTGRSMAELFAEHGVRLTRADSNRVQGWMQLKEYLRLGEGDAPPRLRIFENCENLIRCLPALRRDERDPWDASTQPHEITHICDALRYLIRGRPMSSREPAERTAEQKMRDAAILRCRRGRGGGRFN